MTADGHLLGRWMADPIRRSPPFPMFSPPSFPTPLFLGLLLWLCGSTVSESSNVCLQAPTVAARIVCQQLHKWDHNVREFHSFSHHSSSFHSSSSASSSSSSSTSHGGNHFSRQHTSSSHSSMSSSSSSSSSISVMGHGLSLAPPSSPNQVNPAPTTSQHHRAESDLFQIEANGEFQAPAQKAYVRESQNPNAVVPVPQGNDRAQIQDPFFVRNSSDPFQCLQMKCLCPHLKGTFTANGECLASDGSKIGRAVRKEYRQLTDSERRRFHEALNRVKTKGIFDRFVEEHSDPEKSGGAHSGPAFLPWHREYLKRLEIALRMEDHSVALPYWDSTLDNCLETPRLSVLFTDRFVGANEQQSGYVRDGPFANWVTLESRRPIRRQPGVQGRLLMEEDIDAVLSAPSVSRVMAYTAPRGDSCPHTTDWTCLEYSHGNVHVWVGGEMYDPSTSANDPLFFLHHSFIDLIWETWRQRHQDARQRELQYPEGNNSECSAEEHFAHFPMRPFAPHRNVDGLSNAYTDELYTFSERPSCARTGADAECQSSYLFCDLSRGKRRCAPKLQDNAPCTTYGNRGCQSGNCSGGRCTVTQRRTTITTRNNSLVNIYKTNRQKTTTSCFNENECCLVWAEKGECTRNERYMREWCPASCGVCTPNYDVSLECSDRHGYCRKWAQLGECTRNPLWMNENCRSACRRCALTRRQTCINGY